MNVMRKVYCVLRTAYYVKGFSRFTRLVAPYLLHLLIIGSYRKLGEIISPFIQRFNLDTEHHREGTEKHGEMILSVYLCEKLRETLCN
jgi:hypothetical protein